MNFKQVHNYSCDIPASLAAICLMIMLSALSETMRINIILNTPHAYVQRHTEITETCSVFAKKPKEGFHLPRCPCHFI